MSMKNEIEAGGLDRRAAELERRAKETDVEAHVHFSPSRHAFWQESERADRYRSRAHDLRDQAARLRRQTD
ncbi:hypothetical protein [Spelaeicoccus albus]|uniref:Uncharacterized protein n=1 Tax=Spelaeicoccus albus TaxID=1280376 RepID=A0A7Z0D0Z5_9MICO|nr:hypothetical protein [Spelaeicoccus albus]NYI66083.1 hypothetical protein [Spelaeicoccus albus]